MGLLTVGVGVSLPLSPALETLSLTSFDVRVCVWSYSIFLCPSVNVPGRPALFGGGRWAGRWMGGSGGGEGNWVEWLEEKLGQGVLYEKRI